MVRMHEIRCRRWWSTIESETIESETIKSETTESETIESETIKSETIESETIESETIESEIGFETMIWGLSLETNFLGHGHTESRNK